MRRVAPRLITILTLTVLLTACPGPGTDPVQTSIAFFDANATTIARGDPVTLNWQVINPGTAPDTDPPTFPCSITRRAENEPAEQPFPVEHRLLRRERHHHRARRHRHPQLAGRRPRLCARRRLLQHHPPRRERSRRRTLPRRLHQQPHRDPPRASHRQLHPLPTQRPQGAARPHRPLPHQRRHDRHRGDHVGHRCRRRGVLEGVGRECAR
jgi:hypothetical protein